jgi:hypothetical protein
LLLPVVLLTLVDDLRAGLAFCPDVVADLFVTVVVDRRVAPAFCPDVGLVADLFVTVVVDRRVAPAFCPDVGLVADLFVTVVVDRLVVPIPVDCLEGEALDTDLLLTVVLPVELVLRLLFCD